MSNTLTASAPRKSAYKRPYKSRSQRRESARRKYDESTDRKFLLKAAGAIGLLLVLALGIALKGMSDRSDAGPTTETAAEFR